MRRRHNHRGGNKNVRNIVIGCFVMTLFFGVGYSAFQTNINIKAKGTIKSYIVTFDANGGDVNVKNKRVKYGFNYGNLPIPTREGYTFKGWNGKNMFNISDRTVKECGENTNQSIRNFSGNGIYVGLTANNYCIASYIKNYSLSPFNNNVTVSSASGGYGIGFDFIVSPSKDYTISIGDNSDVDIRIGEYSVGGSFIKWNRILAAKKAYLLTDSNTKYLTIVVAPDDESQFLSDVTNYNIKLEEGNEPAPKWEPYYITNETEVVQEQNHTLTAIWEENS